MQKILVLILAIVSSGLVFNTGYTADPIQSDSIREAASTQAGANTTSSTNTIYTSEMVPGAKCQCVTGGGTSESL